MTSLRTAVAAGKPSDTPASIASTIDTDVLSTREALIAAGERAFAERGYAGSSLTSIASDAGLTTGAFYRHFASKADFYAVLFESYRDELLAALEKARTLRALIETWQEVARHHRGVVRVNQEVAIVGSPEAQSLRELRATVAGLVAEKLEPVGAAGAQSAAALMVSDVVTQYVLMEAAGWVPEREPRAVAVELERLVKRGLYKR